MVWSVAIAGLVVPRWTTDRKVNALTGSNPFKGPYRNLSFVDLFSYCQDIVRKKVSRDLSLWDSI